MGQRAPGVQVENKHKHMGLLSCCQNHGESMTYEEVWWAVAAETLSFVEIAEDGIRFSLARMHPLPSNVFFVAGSAWSK